MLTPLICEKTISTMPMTRAMRTPGRSSSRKPPVSSPSSSRISCELPLGLGAAVDRRQHPQGLVVVARGRQPARALGHEEQADQQAARGNGHAWRTSIASARRTKADRSRSTDSDSPITIASWLTTTSRPRSRAGDTSAMYIGETVEARPDARSRPQTARRLKSSMPCASALPIGGDDEQDRGEDQGACSCPACRPARRRPADRTDSRGSRCR